MKTENEGGISIASVAGTVLRLLGADGGLEPGAAAADERVLAGAPGGRVKKVLVYAPDAIGLGMVGRLPGLFNELDSAGFLKFPVRSVFPPKTPVCFASMFSGLAPEGHGIRRYEKPALACKTVFDALPAAGLRAAIVAVKDSSIDLIFKGRKADYFSEPDDKAATARALELIAAGAHDLLLVYHQEYDDLLHAGDPWGQAAKEAVERHVRAFQALAEAFDKRWAGVPRAVLFAPDHGAHKDPATGQGAHGDDCSEDMDVLHFWKFRPGDSGLDKGTN